MEKNLRVGFLKSKDLLGLGYRNKLFLLGLTSKMINQER